MLQHDGPSDRLELSELAVRNSILQTWLVQPKCVPPTLTAEARQTGVVRARCEEFDPADLAGTAEVRATNPDSGSETVTTAADPFSGLRKLMKALEESMGRTEMDRKAELRKQFYQTIRRSAEVDESPGRKYGAN
eukprot:s2050_g5.t1